MRVLDPLLSWLELWKVLFLVRAGAWLLFLLSRTMAGTSTKLEIKHQHARTAVNGMYLVPVQILPGRTVPGSEGVGVVHDRHIHPAADCPELIVEDLDSLSQSPYGRNNGRHQARQLRDNIFQLSNELPPHALHDHGELARVDRAIDHHAPHLSIPGDVGQPVIDVVDG